MKSASKAAVSSIWNGVKGVVTKPVHEVQIHGAKGIFKVGIAKSSLLNDYDYEVEVEVDVDY